MKNKDLVVLSQNLTKVSNIKGRDFAYAVFKNKSLIEQEMKIFEQLRREPHQDYANYENERTIICITYAKKDDNGNPIIQNNQYIIEDWEGFNKDTSDLRTKYKEVLDDMETTRKDYEEFMERDSTVQLIKVKVSDLPEDVDANILEALKFMIE